MQTLFDISERQHLQVNYLAIFNPNHLIPYGNMTKSSDHVTISMRLGDSIIINGIHIEDNHSNEHWFGQNWSSTGISFLDQILLHPSGSKPIIIDDLFSSELYHYFYQPSVHNELSNFFKGNAFSRISGMFQPKQWEGRTLFIPIDFIRLTHFHREIENGYCTCDIQIGEQLSIRSQEILGTMFKEKLDNIHLNSQNIIDPNILSVINRMLNHGYIKEGLSQQSIPQIDAIVSVPGWKPRPIDTPPTPCFFK